MGAPTKLNLFAKLRPEDLFATLLGCNLSPLLLGLQFYKRLSLLVRSILTFLFQD